NSASVLSNEVAQSEKEFRDLEQRLRKTHKQQRLRDQLERLNTELPGSNWVQIPPLESESLPSPNDDDSLQKRFSSHVASFIESTKESLNQWNLLFGPEGAPDLSFLGTPAEAIERATFLSKEGDYASAQMTLKNAQELLTSWITELQNLHRHSNQSWEKAVSEGGTIETEMGMRFIEHEGLYWSVWETRVMDFAQYIQEFPERSIVIGDYWKNPPYPQGPTHPVVGIDQETASHFATWVAYRIRSKFNSVGFLPATVHWKNLLKENNSNPRMALYPNRNEWSSNHFALYYSDPALKPERYTKPVGMNPPEFNGLFDLSGNLWEWCSDLYEFPARFRNNSEPDTWALMGGNPFQQTSYQSFAPPDPNIIWVIQKHTIGFRIILNLR
ncbi:formylglycine-generating enzyme family protein, partial [bacterium]|nr:formylglycine-generating enzyme family protein [bacterium]